MKITSIDEYRKRLETQGLTAQEIERRIGLANKFKDWIEKKDAPPGAAPTQAHVQPQVLPQSSTTITTKNNTPVSHIVLVGLVFILGIMLTFGVVMATKNTSYPITKTSYVPNTRTLSFSGKLTDAQGLIIAEKTHVVLSLYSSQTGGNQVYSSGVCKVLPNMKGEFETTIGGACGSPIREDVFTRNPNIYLGIKIGNDAEMTPRSPIISSAKASPSAGAAGLGMDENGDILLTHEHPGIQSTMESANFAITSAKGLLLQTAADGDITLSATESGQIKFLVGGQQVGAITNSGNIEVTGNILPTNTGIQDLGSSNNRFRAMYADNIYPGLFGISGYLKREGNTLSTSTVGDELILGSSSASSAKIRLSPFTADKSWFNAGNFGIGTTNPTFNLDVAGTTRIGGDLTVGAPRVSFLTATALSLPGNTVNALAFQTDMLSLDTKNNRVGIGTITPSNKLTVADSQGNMSTLWVENADSGASAKGISVKLGFTGGGNTSNEFITFIKGNGEVQGKIQSNGASGISYSSGGGDFAEYFLKDVNFPLESPPSWAPGTVVCIVADGMVRPCDNTSGAILGVISNNAAFVGNSKGENDEKYVLVGLVGQLGVRVDARSGIIKSGDPLTSFVTSEVTKVSGIVTTALHSGRIIGFAKEGYNGVGSKTIQATIQPGYFEIVSERQLASLSYDGHELTGQTSSILTSLGGSLEKYANLIADRINVREKLTSPVVETDQLVAEKADIKTIQTEKIVPKENSDIVVHLSGETKRDFEPGRGKLSSLLIKGFENQTVASFDAAGNATISGTLQAQNIETELITTDRLDTSNLRAQEATVSGTLTANRIEASNISDIEKMVNDLKNQPLPDARLYEKDTSVFDTVGPIDSLTVLGKTSLYDISVANSFMAGNVAIADDTIAGLSFELKLNALSTINLLDGAVVVSREGNLTTKGELIAQGITIHNDHGKEVASINASGSAYFAGGIGVDTFIANSNNTQSKNSLTAAISTNAESAGDGEIPAGKINVAIYNQRLTTNSLVYLTSTSKTENQPVYVSNKNICQSDPSDQSDRSDELDSCRSYFVVTIDSPIKSTATFNWWIIN